MTYADHPEYRALLAAVRAAPDDDLPRLVLADWLEEQTPPQGGATPYSDRAEFIRVQVELALLRRRVDSAGRRIGHTNAGKIGPLMDRERELFDTRHVRLSFDHFMSLVHRLARSTSSQVRLPHEPDDHYPDRYLLGTVHRGFVAQVRCTLADWCGGECGRCHGSGRYEEYAGAIHFGTHTPFACDACSGTGRTPGIGPQVVAHPVERVVLTDREPDTYDAEGGGMWHSFQHSSSCSGPNEIPHFLRQHFPKDCDGRSRESVMAGLSAALIAWAKSQNVTPATYREHHDHLLGEIARGLGVPAHLLTDSTN